MGTKKRRETQEVAIPIELPKRGRKGMAAWTKKSAQKIARKMRPLVGKKVMLYGGGGAGMNLATLKKVKVEAVTLYGRIVKGKRQDYKKPRKSKSEFRVTVELHDPQGKLPPYPSRTFSPHIGSWKIAKLQKLKRRVK